MKKMLGEQTKKVLTKFMASTLIVTLSCTNFLVCGNYFATYAAEGTELDKQTDATLSKNVKFDAYFEDNGNKTHYKTADMNGETVELVLSTHVQKNGYLKNATINLKNEKGENELNYTITDLEDANAIVQSASENQLVLRQINAGEPIEFKAMLSASATGVIDVEKLNSNNKITLKGLYIDEKGEETPIDKEIEINLGWTGKYQAEIKQSLLKYIPLEKEDGNKTLISMQIEAGLKEEKFMLPIKETKLEIEVPSINGEKPKSVTVNAISTEASNGLTSENLTFTEDNWEYSESEGKVEIKVTNEEKVRGKGKDIYIVNYIYSERVYEALEKQEATINAQAKVTIQTYSNNEIQECTATANDKIQLSETKGKLVSLTGESLTESIAKGKLYANINNPQSNDNTEYEYKWDINVAYNEGLNGIVLEDKQEKMTTAQNINGDLTGKTIYKQIVFNSSAFDEVLGDEGKVSIYNKENRIIALVAKDSRTDKNGNYLVELLEDISEIKLVTSKPVKDGNLVIIIKKEIKSDLGFTKPQIDNFETLNIVSTISQIDEKTNEAIAVEEKVVSIPLEATVTKSQISINKEKLSTLVKNENVEITIELGNDNETSDLYVDPIFEIELPQCVENVEILESKILFDEELLIDKVEFIQKEGIPVLRVMLNGVQTKYSSGVVTNGTNIVLKTNVTVNRITPTSTEEIKMYYYNSNTVNYDNGVQTDKGLGGLATTSIQFVAPTGMLTINGMENYNENGDILMSVNQGDLMQQVITYRPARIAKMRLLAINNTGNMCNNIVILGRVPFAGNKDLETGEDLGTTIDTYLRSFIVPENLQGDGIKIYYSANGEATSAVGDANNAWTDVPTDLSQMKSYMIVLEGYEMQQGEAIEFSYDFEIPANMGYNNTINSNYGIYYVNNTQVATVSSFAKADRVGITTGTGPELKILQTVEGANEDGTVEAYKVLKFTVNLTNEGTESAKGVIIKNDIPKWTSLVRLSSKMPYNYEIFPDNADENTMKEWNVIKSEGEGIEKTVTVGWEIDNIEPEETITRELYVLIQSKPDVYTYYKDYAGFTIDENGKYYISTSKYDANMDTSYEEKNEIVSVPDIDVKNVILVEADNINTTLKSTSNELEVRESNIVIREMTDLDENNQLTENKEFNFVIGISNIDENIAKDLSVIKNIPDGLKYISLYAEKKDSENNVISKNIEGEYDETTRNVTIKIPEISNGENISISIKVKVNKLEQGIYEKEIESTTKVLRESELLTSGETIKLKIVKPQYIATQECSNTNPTLNEGDEIEYTLRVSNIGKIEIYGVNVEINMPECFKILSASYQMQGENVKIEKTSLNKFMESIGLDIGETITFTIRVKVKKVKEDTPVTTNAYLYGNGLENIFTDVIFQTVEQSADYKENNNDNNSENENQSDNTNQLEKTYKISGRVWEDSNEDGQKEGTELLLEGISVMLIDSLTGNLVTDIETGEFIQTTTDKEGKYLLTNVKPGKYIIVFRYDTNIYTVTNYEKENISEIYNSNAIEKEITIEGEKTKVGVSDIINLDSTKTNINLGLVNKMKFDLRLEKSITKVTVQNRDEVKNYDFDNSKLAKVEIPSSKLNNTVVIIEYTIRVTNEGNVPGYAKNIVDYKAKDLTFNSSLNTSWYVGNDGNVYTMALENTVINPGETKEVKLLVTKQMTDNNVGITNNIAEIKESYNEQGIQDKDSIGGNNAQGEDDRDTADIIVIIKTGGVAFYTILIIGLLIILSVGICLIKETNILRDKEVYK